jgi:hypothetical protein
MCEAPKMAGKVTRSWENHAWFWEKVAWFLENRAWSPENRARFRRKRVSFSQKTASKRQPQTRFRGKVARNRRWGSLRANVQAQAQPPEWGVVCKNAVRVSIIGQLPSVAAVACSAFLLPLSNAIMVTLLRDSLSATRRLRRRWFLLSLKRLWLYSSNRLPSGRFRSVAPSAPCLAAR